MEKDLIASPPWETGQSPPLALRVSSSRPAYCPADGCSSSLPSPASPHSPEPKHRACNPRSAPAPLHPPALAHTVLLTRKAFCSLFFQHSPPQSSVQPTLHLPGELFPSRKLPFHSSEVLGSVSNAVRTDSQLLFLFISVSSTKPSLLQDQELSLPHLCIPTSSLAPDAVEMCTGKLVTPGRCALASQ